MGIKTIIRDALMVLVLIVIGTLLVWVAYWPGPVTFAMNRTVGDSIFMSVLAGLTIAGARHPVRRFRHVFATALLAWGLEVLLLVPALLHMRRAAAWHSLLSLFLMNLTAAGVGGALSFLFVHNGTVRAPMR